MLKALTKRTLWYRDSPATSLRSCWGRAQRMSLKKLWLAWFQQSQAQMAKSIQKAYLPSLNILSLTLCNWGNRIRGAQKHKNSLMRTMKVKFNKRNKSIWVERVLKGNSSVVWTTLNRHPIETIKFLLVPYLSDLPQDRAVKDQALVSLSTHKVTWPKLST